MWKSCPEGVALCALIVCTVTLSACSPQPVKDIESPSSVEPPTDDATPYHSHAPPPVTVERSTSPVSLPSAAQAKPRPAAQQKPMTNATPPDIWGRVRDGFSLPLVEDDARVAHYQAWYSTQPDYMRRITGRARPYLHFILEEIERRGMPTELALLPIVESAYLPYAYSHAHASGLWQFIPETARLYGLKQNWWYDGRRDIYAATLAALAYLQALNELFEGDWLHTLAAYNAGPNRVLTEIQANRLAGEPVDFWHLNLPLETRNYVPKLLAVRTLVEDPMRFGVELCPIADEPYLATIDLKEQFDLALAAKLAGMKAHRFNLLNPGFNRWVTDPNGPHRLLLPVDRIEHFKQGLAELPTDRRVTWLMHYIQPGETLSRISRRYNSSVELLMQTNALSSSQIIAGDQLLVPRPLATRTTVSQIESKRAQPYRHTVLSGDSLWSIARSYDVSVFQLASWNGLASGGLIRPGDELVIWTSTPSEDERESQLVELTSALKTVNYLVQEGDSLYTIAQRYKVSLEDLRRWNNMEGESRLYPGQAMTLYVDATLFYGDS
jgi:membrane-bound lytic murein transglycosylase D